MRFSLMSLEAAGVVPDAEIRDVVVQRIAGEIAAPDVLVNGAIDVIAQDAALVVAVMIVVIVNCRSTKSGHLDDLASEAHVCEAEAAADQTTIAE